MTTDPRRQVLRVLSLGWGVQSWTIAAMMALDEMEKVDFAVFADTTRLRLPLLARPAKRRGGRRPPSSISRQSLAALASLRETRPGRQRG